MRRLFQTILFLFISVCAFGQNGYNTFGLSGGLSANNSKMISLQYETSKKGNFALGIIAERTYYAYDKRPISIYADEIINAGGLFLKWRLHSTRNFNTGIYFGGAIGSLNGKFAWYPFLGLQQNIFISSSLILFTQERLTYLTKVPKDNNWQPAVSIGLKFKL